MLLQFYFMLEDAAFYYFSKALLLCDDPVCLEVAVHSSTWCDKFSIMLSVG